MGSRSERCAELAAPGPRHRAPRAAPVVADAVAPAACERLRAKQVLEYLCARLLLAVVDLLPERAAYGTIGTLGRLYFRCSRKRQARALRFLGVARPDLGEAERLALGRVATGNLFKVVLDVVRLDRYAARDELQSRIDTREAESLLPSPPFLAVTGHLGSWEVAGAALGVLSGEAHALAHSFRNPLLQRFVVRKRQRAGLHVHPKRGGIRDLLRALERGCVGLQVVDQHQRLRGVVAPFFGVPASNERSAAVLARRRDLPVVVGAAIRTGPGFRFKLVAYAPLRTQRTTDAERDVASMVAELNRRLEQLILAHPEQYVWIHNRFRDADGVPAPCGPVLDTNGRGSAPPAAAPEATAHG